MSDKITTKQIAEELGVSGQTVRNWIKVFDIPHENINGNILKFDPGTFDVFRLIASLTDTSGKDTIKKKITPFVDKQPTNIEQTTNKQPTNENIIRQIVEQTTAKLDTTIKENTELAEKYARATYQIGQLENEVKHLQEKLKLLPPAGEIEKMKIELEYYKKPWYKRIFRF